MHIPTKRASRFQRSVRRGDPPVLGGRDGNSPHEVRSFRGSQGSTRNTSDRCIVKSAVVSEKWATSRLRWDQLRLDSLFPEHAVLAH